MEQTIWKYLEEVSDPEIPVISIIDLGIVRSVKWLPNEQAKIVISPTYSGCPALNEIKMSIRMKLYEKGLYHVEVIEQLSPAWTTEDLTENAKEKMKAYGIAPPVSARFCDQLFEEETGIECPLCASKQTVLISQFGSTACKALYRCQSCEEPFDYFKCHH